MNSAVLLLADGRFPTGGHAHSAGTEAAVAFGDVHDGASLTRFLAGRLATTGVTEAAFAVAAWAIDESAALDDLSRELDARMCAPRTREVSRRLGRQLLRVGRRTWPHPLLDHLAAPPGPHQAVVSGVLTARVGGSADDAARLVMHHLSASVTGAAVRLLGLDPIAVAAVQAAAAPLVDELLADVDRWRSCPSSQLPAVGGALAEVLAEHHATWDARLFVG